MHLKYFLFNIQLYHLSDGRRNSNENFLRFFFSLLFYAFFFLMTSMMFLELTTATEAVSIFNFFLFFWILKFSEIKLTEMITRKFFFFYVTRGPSNFWSFTWLSLSCLHSFVIFFFYSHFNSRHCLMTILSQFYFFFFVCRAMKIKFMLLATENSKCSS